MKKGKSITLLTILSVILAVLLVITFVRFEVGVNNFNSVLGAIELDYDIGGGTAYTLTLSKDNIKDDASENIDNIVKTLEERMLALGYSTFSIDAVKDTDKDVLDYDIVIAAKAPLSDNGDLMYSTLTKDISVAAAYGELKFYGDAAADPGEDKEILTDGQVIECAKALAPITDGEVAYYQVAINFTDYGFNAIDSLIKENNDKYFLKIMLGDIVLLDASSENNYITSSYFQGKTINLTTSDETSAKQTALQINSGGLAYKYEISEGVNISAPLGENIPTIALMAISAFILVIMITLIIFYKIYGVIFDLSLLFFVLLEVIMLIAVPGIKLSIGGIIGIVFATVLTCDGFIITIKRIKEEFEKGKTVKSAVKVGYSRSLIPIITIGVITGVVSLALFAFTTGVLQCFAITLGIGAVLNVITNLLITRMFSAIILPLVNYKETAINFNRTEE